MLSLQHDGVIIGLEGRREEDEEEGNRMRGELTRAVSGAVGYEVRVTHGSGVGKRGRCLPLIRRRQGMGVQG